MTYILRFLSFIMRWCYSVCSNYGLAIILFTFISKVVLLPLSIWVQNNSIKMVRMQPELYELKTMYYGDNDTIADKQAALYKREKYNAFASVIPMVIQISLLIALISAIKSGIIAGIETYFFGISIDKIPIKEKGIYLIIPFIAGGVAYLLCFVQNRVNVLQANSSIFEKYFTMVVSVGLSLYLGFYVQVGVIIYWIFSNLFGIIQIFFLNKIIDPKKFINYEKLEKAKKAFDEIENVGKKNTVSKEDKKRERVDYKHFFSIGNKHLVFYSESNGFFKYFKGVIKYILDNTNIVIHYITSDPKDNVFKLAEVYPQIKPYYIGEKKLITLMMKMDADVVVMTTPDLENFHIKRSYVRKDIEYIYIQHHMGSINMILRKGAVDHFDTILISTRNQKEEIEGIEKFYGLKKKNLVEYGYPLLDDMIAEYKMFQRKSTDEQKMILIAPSWHSQGIMFTCIEELIDGLRGNGWKIILRPHPQFVRHNRNVLENLGRKYAENADIEIQFDFTSNNPVIKADLVVTDWSAIAYEYSFTTFKPVLYVDVPMKVNNPDWKEPGIEPIDIWIRNKIGVSVQPSSLCDVAKVVRRLFDEGDRYRHDIEKLRDECVYNIGTSAEYGARYIIGTIQEKIKNKKGGK